MSKVNSTGISCVSKWAKVSAVSKRLCVSRQQVRLLVKAGELNAVRTVGGHRLIEWASVLAYEGFDSDENSSDKIPVAVVSRCSTAKQAGDLERQETRLAEYVKDRWGEKAETTEYSRLASGMHYSEPTFLRLVSDVLGGKFKGGFVVCTFPDRILRFGLPLFSQICEFGGCEIVCIADGEEDKEDTQSLADDVLAVITHFSARKHGARAKETCEKKLSDDCVKRIFELRKENRDIVSIHKAIVAEGFLDSHNETPSYFCISRYIKKGDLAKISGVENESLGFDLFSDFIKKCCRKVENGRVKNTALREAYASFCQQQGKQPESAMTMGAYISKMGLRRTKSNGERITLGITLA